MIAVHGVKSHPEPRYKNVFLLHVPSKCVHSEAVNEGHETAVPVCVVHVQSVDIVLGENGRPPLNTFCQARQSG